MKKLIILYFTVTLFSTLGYAGQDPLYSQFMTNPYLINPGLTGTFDYYQIISNNRLQWLGFTDAPMTNFISMYGPMKKQPMGLGGFIMNDIAGPESVTSFNLSYAYHYGVMEDLKLSMGLMVGVLQHKIDGTKINLENSNDQTFHEGQIYQNYKPDATLGFYAWSSFYHVGLSLTNLFGNKLQFEADTNTFESKLKQHFYLHGGYNFLITRELQIEPQLILRAVSATTPQLDINARVWYGRRQWNDNKLWGGFSFRTNESVSVLIGVLYQKKIEIGYSYDFPVNKMRKMHNGSHELMIAFKFNDIREY